MLMSVGCIYWLSTLQEYIWSRVSSEGIYFHALLFLVSSCITVTCSNPVICHQMSHIYLIPRTPLPSTKSTNSKKHLTRLGDRVIWRATLRHLSARVNCLHRCRTRLTNSLLWGQQDYSLCKIY